VAASLGATRQADDIIGLLDIGNSKTVCLIAAVPISGRRPGRPRVLGIGVQPTRGLKAGVVVALDDLHAPAAEHERWAYQDRVADPVGDRQRLIDRHDGGAGRLRDREPNDQILEQAAVLRKIDAG